MTTTPGDEAILSGVLDRWKAAVDAHRPERVAALFTEDAVFQGLHPYSVGRPGVAAYCDSQPLGTKAAYRVLETGGPPKRASSATWRPTPPGCCGRPPCTTGRSVL